VPPSLSPKYRRLTSGELEALEREFILYLASRGIAADRWIQLLESDPGQVENTIISFSDLILQNIYEKCSLVEQVTSNGWLLYRFDEATGSIELRGVTLADERAPDLKTIEKDALISWIQSAPSGSVQLIRARKAMTRSKAEEVDQLLKMGGFLSENQEFFEQLNRLFDREVKSGN
jgi:hypothetical protein